MVYCPTPGGEVGEQAAVDAIHPAEDLLLVAVETSARAEVFQFALGEDHFGC